MLVTLGIAVGLALAGCTDPSSSNTADVGERQAPETWPLTGLRSGSDSAAKDHPVLVLKLDNTASSAPQQGLSSADLVVEELVEGGVTRLAVFFYSRTPGVVGPVRSMRASDIGIVSPVDATMVTSGAAAQTITRLRRADVPYVTEGSAGFFREAARRAPYDLMADLGDVAEALRVDDAVRPPDYLPFGPARRLPAGQPATSFDVRFSSAHTTSWSYDDEGERVGYVDTGSLAATGDEFPADSVLVLRVKVGDAGYRDPAGNTVPETKLVGEGAAQLFHAGRVVPGTWSKSTLDSPLRLTRTTPQGEVELAVPPGRTWIELVPMATGGVDVSP